MHSASRRNSSRPDGGISRPGTIHGTSPGYRAGLRLSQEPRGSRMNGVTPGRVDRATPVGPQTDAEAI